MDEKKVREAIEVIKGYRRLDEYMNNTKRLPYCDMAIEALEKQLPKKPVLKRKAYGGIMVCPICEVSDYGKYCRHCGQKIKWSE